MTKHFFGTTMAATCMALLLGTSVAAEEISIEVWSMSNDSESYRIDAISMAADILSRESSIRGQDLKITVTGRRDFGEWDEFKQAVTLAAEAGTAPGIVVTSHLDIAPWSQAGYIVPVENYVDLDAWPLNDIYPNIMEIASSQGTQWGIPQDTESRPFFFWIPTMKAIGYSDADIAALPERIASGDYKLSDVLVDAKKAVDMGIVKEGYGFYPRVSNGPDYAQFYQSFGGELVDEATGKLIFDRKATTEFYQFFVDAVEAGLTRKNHIGTTWDQWYTEVATGQAAFWHGGTWHYARYTGKEGNTDFFNTVGFSLIPAGNAEGRANTITHPLVYLVTKQADSRAEEIAAQLIAIASEPRLNTLHAIKSAHLAISKSQSGIDLYSSDRWTAEATTRLLPFANSQPNNLRYGAFSEALFKGLESAWTGTQTVEAAVAEVEAQLTATIGDQLIVR
ncbi:MAG: extracellular solute-binding protein [Verrucomicrobia bacterium]|nr:extracellular solute-binding protein [Verrucomicrobiota bacterium]